VGGNESPMSSIPASIYSGNVRGHFSAWLGKADEVPVQITKGREDVKKHVIEVPLVDRTIPHHVVADFGAARVILRPAAKGNGVIAGGSVRAVVESAGISDILSKSLGSTNPVNVVMATMKALGQLRSAETVRQMRGLRTRQPEPVAT